MNKTIFIFLVPLLAFSQQNISLSIHESIDLALKNNPSIKIAGEKVKDSQQGMYQAYGSALPTINLQGSQILDEKVQTIVNPFPIPGGPATLTLDFTQDYQYDIRVTQPLFTGGKIALGTLMARKGLELTRSQLENEKNQLSYNVIQAYLGLLVTREFQKVAEDGYQTAFEFFEISQLLFQQGMISKLDLLQAEVQAANLLPQKTQAENGVTLARAGLKMLLGLESDSELILTDKLEYKPLDVDLDNLKAKALSQRPEVQQMKISQSLSALNVNMARSEFLPMIALSYSYSKYGNDLDLFSDWDDSNMLAVGLSYNIFSGGTRYSKVKQAKIAQRQLSYGQEAMADVEQAYLRLIEAEKNILSQKKTVDQAEEASRLAKLQYREGTITNLQANQIQISLTMAKANYLQALFNYALADASIKKATGESLYSEGITSK